MLAWAGPSGGSLSPRAGPIQIGWSERKNAPRRITGREARSAKKPRLSGALKGCSISSASGKLGELTRRHQVGEVSRFRHQPMLNRPRKNGPPETWMPLMFRLPRLAICDDQPDPHVAKAYGVDGCGAGQDGDSRRSRAPARAPATAGVDGEQVEPGIYAGGDQRCAHWPALSKMLGVIGRAGCSPRKRGRA